MKSLSKIKFKKLKDFLKNLPRILAGHYFLTFFIIFFLSLILAGFIFYKYVFLAEKAEPKIINPPLRFEQGLYQKVLGEWQKREKRLKEADSKEYSNPFRGSVPSPSSPSPPPSPSPSPSPPLSSPSTSTPSVSTSTSPGEGLTQ